MPPFCWATLFFQPLSRLLFGQFLLLSELRGLRRFLTISRYLLAVYCVVVQAGQAFSHTLRRYFECGGLAAVFLFGVCRKRKLAHCRLAAVARAIANCFPTRFITRLRCAPDSRFLAFSHSRTARLLLHCAVIFLAFLLI